MEPFPFWRIPNAPLPVKNRKRKKIAKPQIENRVRSQDGSLATGANAEAPKTAVNNF